jgi:hypothetical protein
VLARLDEIDGVAESRVDWTGTRFLLTLDAHAPRQHVGEKAAATLGDGARVLEAQEARDALAAYRAGETWMRAGETLRLSKFEAGVLAERHGGEAAQELGLDAGDTQRLIALFQGELERAFERTHARGGIAAVPEEFEAAAERLLEASAEFLDADQRTSLTGYLERFWEARTR